MDDDDDFGDFEEPEAFTGKFFQKHFLHTAGVQVLVHLETFKALFLL